MKDFDESWHKTATQARSQATIDSIFEATEILAKQGRPDLLSIRHISEQSGYSVGSIYHYFEKIDDIFVGLLVNRKLQSMQRLIAKVDAFPSDGSLEEIIELMVNFLMDEWSIPHPSVLRFVIRQFFKRSKEPEKLNKFIDILVLPLMKLIERDTTGEMPHLQPKELALYLRALQAMVRSMFFEESPEAGSEWHRKIVIGAAVALFKTKAEQNRTVFDVL
jgi:AcrR family transcriptional regulator